MYIYRAEIQSPDGSWQGIYGQAGSLEEELREIYLEDYDPSREGTCYFYGSLEVARTRRVEVPDIYPFRVVRLPWYIWNHREIPLKEVELYELGTRQYLIRITEDEIGQLGEVVFERR